MKYLPEGYRIHTAENENYLRSPQGLEAAMAEGAVLEAKALLCTENHNLVVELPGGLRGVIPREETALGIAEGTTRDIAVISRVGKPVCFQVTGISVKSGMLSPVLSRRAAQKRCKEEYLSTLQPGRVIPARVTHLEQFGAFADIGCGIVSLIPIDMISVSRISHPKDRFFPGEFIKAVVKDNDGDRIYLSHKELLGSWEENAANFHPGETVSGIVRSVEQYGIFVELAPNLAGLAELKPGVLPGQKASVYIKSLIPEKMKIKLVIIDSFFEEERPRPMHYYIEDGVLSRWLYTPESCEKRIETVF